MKSIYQKLGTVLLVAAMSSSPIRGATGIEIGAAAGLLGSLLAPMIRPMIAEFQEETQKRIDGVMRDLKGMSGCNTICNTKVSCKSKRIASICKRQCQKRMKVGPYTLKIRYSNTSTSSPSWNLQQCVEAAPDDPKKVKNTKEIAVYGEEDFNFAVEMIAEMAALDKFILLKGRVPQATINKDDKDIKDDKEDSKRKGKKDLKKPSKTTPSAAPVKPTPEELAKLVDEAKKERQELGEAFEEHVQKYFGPQ